MRPTSTLVMEPELDLLRKISRSLALTFLYSARKASSVCACAVDGLNFFCFIAAHEFLYTVFIFNAKFVEINLFVDVRAVRPVCAQHRRSEESCFLGTAGLFRIQNYRIPNRRSTVCGIRRRTGTASRVYRWGSFFHRLVHSDVRQEHNHSRG